MGIPALRNVFKGENVVEHARTLLVNPYAQLVKNAHAATKFTAGKMTRSKASENTHGKKADTRMQCMAVGLSACYVHRPKCSIVHCRSAC